MIEHFINGFIPLMHWKNILAIIGGSVVGYLVGALPGLSATMGIALCLPFIFYLPPLASLLFLTSLYGAAEYGYDIVITQYRGFAAKKGLPPDVRAILVDTIRKSMAEPGFKEYLAKNSQFAEFMGPEEFTAAVRADYEYMGKLMQKVVKK